MTARNRVDSACPRRVTSTMNIDHAASPNAGALSWERHAASRGEVPRNPLATVGLRHPLKQLSDPGSQGLYTVGEIASHATGDEVSRVMANARTPALGRHALAWSRVQRTWCVYVCTFRGLTRRPSLSQQFIGDGR